VRPLFIKLKDEALNKAQNIIGAPVENIYLSDNKDKMIIFTKYNPKNLAAKQKQLSEFFGIPVQIKSYSYHTFFYLEYKDGKWIAPNQFAIERMADRSVVKKQNNVKPISIKKALVSQPKSALLVAKVFKKISDNQIVVADDSEAVTLTAYTSKPYMFKNINEGQYIVARVHYFQGQFVTSAVKPIEKKYDDVERVDFHIRTKYSPTMSVINIDGLVQEAKNRNYKAIGIADLNSVQGFPVLEKSAKEHGLKPIYATEITLYNEDSKIIENLKDDFRLSSQTYVVFDLETTGTSPKYDDIIEIGAVKLENGQIIDTFYSLVKPNTEISRIAKKVTGITEDMLKDAPTITEIWPKFKKFIQDSVLVAHNADFDYSFLKAIDPKLDISYLDTLRMSRAVQPNRKRHGLAALAKQFKIGEFKHHRADEDAKVLAQIFLKLLEKAYKKEVFSAQELNKLGEENVIDRKTYTLTVVVKNQTGLKNLYRMISDAHTKYLYHGTPALPVNKIMDYKDGILYGAGLEGSILYHMIHNNHPIEDIIKFSAQLDFIEIAPVETAIETENAGKIYPVIAKLAKKLKKPLIATSFAHYISDMDKIAFRALVNSKKANLSKIDHIEAKFLKTEELIKKIASFTDEQTAYQAVVVNPIELANKIEDITIVKGKLTPPGIPNSDKELKELTKEGLIREYGKNPHPEVLARVKKELDSIIKHGFAELYLLARMVVKYSNDNGYIVGSRGSVGSSLVAYLIGITEVNPLPAHYVCPKCKHTEFVDAPTGYDAPDKFCTKCEVKMEKRGLNIPFETFVGFEGDKVPDIDLNFSDEFQDKAHEFVRQTFGYNKVFRAGTILTVAEKNAFAIARDYAHIAGQMSEEYIQYIAKRIEGAKMGTSQHPGGLLIVPKDYEVYDFTPYNHPANDTTQAWITHIAYEHIHDDIVKLDALGHLNPTILKYLHEFTGINPLTVPMDDPEVMKLFNSSEYKNELTSVDTIGVPEFGTPFVRRILDETRPTTFDELVRIAGLSHGTNVWNGNAQTLIQMGKTTLKEVIAARDDIMIYLIRKGLDRKHAFDIMERVRKGKKLREEDKEAMKKAGVPDWYIESCDKIEYLFPKAHAAAYTIMSYRIAWFKRYYPTAFYAAILSKKNSVTHEYFMMNAKDLLAKIFDMAQSKNAKDKKDMATLEIIYDAKIHGVEFSLPNIYESRAEIFVPKGNTILLPFNVIKGIGTMVARSIETARNERQFTSLDDFKKRTKVNKTQIVLLQEMGALGSLEQEAITLFS
jgi:DNA polymerase-3 subunit alpha (Gram-positive type)